MMHDMRDKEQYLRQRIKHLDLKQLKTVGDLVEGMNYTSYQSRNLARAFEVYKAILEDPDRPTVFLALAGAMTPGGQRKIIADLIREKLVDVVVSTGANLYHDFCEALGVPPFIGSAHLDDVKLRELRIDRIYDTLVDEEECIKIDNLIAGIAAEFAPGEYSTRELLWKMGTATEDEDSVLHVASKYHVPIYCPAIADSGIGIGLTKYYLERSKRMGAAIFNTVRDNYEMAQIKAHSKKTAEFIIGGGVPKNYVQQVTVILDLLGQECSGHSYALQITTDDPKWGGLSGCTFNESKSWGKIASDAMKATVYVDATIGVPMLVGAVLQKCADLITKRPRMRILWSGDKLSGIRYE